MMLRVRLFVTLLTLSVAACAARPQQTLGIAKADANGASRAQASDVSSVSPRTPAPLLVVLVVDQLAAWIMEERMRQLPASGGFARLQREGLFIKELRYEHATTSTAPGHAALFTGLPPKGSGVWANDRIDPLTRHAVSILYDVETRLTADAPFDVAGSSPKHLETPTIADALRVARPDAEIIALSLKDRGAIIAGGHKPTASVWYDPKRGSFVTSTAYAQALPGWARAYNAQLSRVFNRSWTLFDAEWVKRNARTPDRQLGEGDTGLGIEFPHELFKAPKPAAAFRGTPFADEVLFELALRALAHTNPKHPRLLAVSLSAFDYISHIYGPDSWEAWDELRRLDQALGVFLQALDKQTGGYSLMLSADHGTISLPETVGDARARPWCASGVKDRFQRPCAEGGRLLHNAILQELELVAREAVGDGDWILGLLEPFVYFTPRAKALDEDRRQKLVQACAAALTRHREIARVVDTKTLAGDCAPASDDGIDALICRSLTGGAGELYILVEPGSFFEPSTPRGHGVNHGSPYLYDRTAPLFIRTESHTRKGEVLNGPVSPADFVRTASALLGIAPPKGGAHGRDLSR